MKDTPIATKWLHGWALVPLVLLLLAGLPIAVWLDLRNLSENALRHQAGDLNSLLTSVRGYYATNIVCRVLAQPSATQVVHNYHDIPGAIPIPATLSIELGQVIKEQQANIAYRFVSDYPFQNRLPHALDEFERSSLLALRNNPQQEFTDVSWSGFSGRSWKSRLLAFAIVGSRTG